LDSIKKYAQQPDIRFQSDARTTTLASAVAFPVAVVVRKPSHDSALTAARQTLALIEKDIAVLGVGSVELSIIDVRFEVEPKGTVLLELNGLLKVTPSGPTDFWPRVEGIARVLDVIQKQGQPAKDRPDVGVYTARAELSPAASETVATGT
jgi:hypothetical protein